MNRRNALKIFGAATLGAVLPLTARDRVFAQAAAGPFTLAPIGYAYEALEPHIDAQTMTIHHQRHHGAYVSNLNNLAGQYAALKPDAIETVLRNLQAAPEAVRTGIRNNLGGHWNHVHFWEVMMPGGAKEPGTELATAINGAFTDFSQFRQRLNAAAGGRFGSGWAWLVVDKDRKLAIVSTANQDNPLMDGAKGVVLGVDVWEHAYYLKYQNRRADYVTAWWNTVNWTKAAANYQKAMT